MEYALLTGGWIAYLTLHSLLAANVTKRAAEQMLGSGFRYYRLVYSVIATVGLVALLILNGRISSPYYFEPAGFSRFLSLPITTLGVILIQVAFRNYRLRAFLGFEPEVNHLKTRGILDWVRHPIYSGLILVTVGFFLFVPNLPTLISCACILLYLPVGIALEERKLIREFGQAYLDYRKKVPAIIPRWSRLVSR